jgi:hypothetical protein
MQTDLDLPSVYLQGTVFTKITFDISTSDDGRQSEKKGLSDSALHHTMMFSTPLFKIQAVRNLTACSTSPHGRY